MQFPIALRFVSATFAALLCVLCGQKLYTAECAKEIAKDAKKVKRRHYRILRVNVRIQQLMMN